MARPLQGRLTAVPDQGALARPLSPLPENDMGTCPGPRALLSRQGQMHDLEALRRGWMLPQPPAAKGGSSQALGWAKGHSKGSLAFQAALPSPGSHSASSCCLRATVEPSCQLFPCRPGWVEGPMGVPQPDTPWGTSGLPPEGQRPCPAPRAATPHPPALSLCISVWTGSLPWLCGAKWSDWTLQVPPSDKGHCRGQAGCLGRGLPPIGWRQNTNATLQVGISEG